MPEELATPEVDRPRLADAPAPVTSPPPAAPTSLVGRWLRGFGRFWWDFLVGDTPELLIGVLAAIGVVALLVKASTLNAAAVGAFPVIVFLLLAGSVFWARRRKRGH